MSDGYLEKREVVGVPRSSLAEDWGDWIEARPLEWERSLEKEFQTLKGALEGGLSSMKELVDTQVTQGVVENDQMRALQRGVADARRVELEIEEKINHGYSEKLQGDYEEASGDHARLIKESEGRFREALEATPAHKRLRALEYIRSLIPKDFNEERSDRAVLLDLTFKLAVMLEAANSIGSNSWKGDDSADFDGFGGSPEYLGYGEGQNEVLYRVILMKGDEKYPANWGLFMTDWGIKFGDLYPNDKKRISRSRWKPVQEK